MKNRTLDTIVICAMTVAVLLGCNFNLNGDKAGMYSPGKVVHPSSHPRIELLDNADLIAFPDKTGDGTVDVPYVIQDLVIDANGTGSCITIKNTDKYLTILNCTLLNCDFYSISNAGINLNNCTNLNITQCLLYNNSVGIKIYSSINCNLSFNVVKYCWWEGIKILDSSSSTIKYNNISNCHSSIYMGLYSFNNTLEGNRIINSSSSGIFCDLSSDIIMKDNYVCSPFSNYGFYLWSGSDNEITSNNITMGVKGTSIYLTGSNSNLVSSNVLHDGIAGITTHLSKDNRIIDNAIVNASRTGLLVDGSVNGTFQWNFLINCGFQFTGTTLDHYAYHFLDTTNVVNAIPVSYHANATGLALSNNSNPWQVILANCNDSAISGIDTSGGWRGITLYRANDIAIDNCKANDGWQGLFANGSSDISISSSEFSGNLDAGVFIEDSERVNIDRCNARQNGENGLEFSYTETLDVSNSDVVENGGSGINMTRCNYITIESNTISGNGGFGIYSLYNGNGDIINNYIHDNELGCIDDFWGNLNIEGNDMDCDPEDPTVIIVVTAGIISASSIAIYTVHRKRNTTRRRKVPVKI